jgi:hypothetical protein
MSPPAYRPTVTSKGTAMNTNTFTRAAGASVLLAVLLGSTACGTETVNTDPGSPVAPAKTKGAPSGVSADALERKAAADKKRQDQASIDRWDRSSQFEQKGLPGRP